MFKNEKDLKKAVENFKLALNDRGGIYYLDSMIEIIKILKDQKRYGEAVDLFFKYGFNEDLPAGTAEELYIMIADLYYNMKDYKSAAKEYRRFIEEFPASKDLAKAMFYLANSIENFDRDPDYKEAYRIYKIIIEEYPVSGYSSLAKNRMLVLERDYLKVF